MASFGLAAVGLAMLPMRTGYQDLAALIVRQPTAGESLPSGHISVCSVFFCDASSSTAPRA